MPVETVPTPSAPPGRRARTRPRCAPATGWCSPGQVGLDPATGAHRRRRRARRRRARCSPTSPRCSRDCGAALTDVAKTTVFVTDIGEFATVNAVYAEAFGDHRPARSTVQVAALPGGAEVEIEVWAYVRRARAQVG